MDLVTGLIASKLITEGTKGVSSLVNNQSPANLETKTQTPDSSFESLLRDMLQPDAANNVNEEELFASLIYKQIHALKGEDTAKEYKQLFEERKSATQRADGYIFVEQSAEEALDGMVQAGVISESDATKIHSKAFTAAQLDDNHSELWDSMGSGSDPTIAAMSIEDAIATARLQLEALEQTKDGETEKELTEEQSEKTVEKSSGSEQSQVLAPTGNTFAGDGVGFVFKPKAENSDRLVVLLPALLAGEVQEVVIKDKDGKVLEQGVSSGFANPDQIGEREHFRFSKTGGDYPREIRVEVALKDGSSMIFEIPDPSERYG